MPIIKKDLYVDFFILFLFGYFLTSINSQPLNIYFEGVAFEYGETVNYIDLARSISPIVCLIILIFGLFILSYKKKIIINKFYYIFLLYFLSQALFTINFHEINYNKFYDTGMNDFYWLVAGFCSICFFIIFDNYKKKINHKCFYLFLFIIFCVGSLFIAKLIKTIYWDSLDSIYLFRNYFYGHSIVGPQARFINAPVPGSGGLARIVSIFFCLSLTFYFYIKPRNSWVVNNLTFKLISLIFMIFCVAIILHLQSRIMMIFLFILTLFLLFNFDNLSYMKKILSICIIFLLPYLFYIFEPSIRYNYTKNIWEKKIFEIKKNRIRVIAKRVLTQKLIYSLEEKIFVNTKIDLNKNFNYNQQNSEKITENNIEKSTENSIEKSTENSIEKSTENSIVINIESNIENSIQNSIRKKIKNLDGEEIISAAAETPIKKHARNIADSSGRFYLWSKSYEMIKNNYFILGYGPQADRKYLNQNVSNLYIYSYLAGGLSGIICILAIMISHIFLLYKVIFSFRIFKKDKEWINKFSIFLIILIYTRSLTENTFGIHSIDMILLLFANHFLMLYAKKNDKKHHVFSTNFT